ncbi:MAG: sigma-70 family RNA polymerase sigma factor [Verrucomicrobiota bacterium]
MSPRSHAISAWERGIFPVRNPAVKEPRGLGLTLLVGSPLARTTILGQSRGATYDLPSTVNPPDLTLHEQILPRVAAGEARAMNLCITQYGGIVWAIAKRYIKDNSEAEDLVQEVFTEIWKKAASFDPSIASESTFVGLIARRRAIDFLRRQGRQPGFEPLAAAESLPHPTSETSSITCDPETVKSSLANLPSDTRQLFHLFFEDGFTHPEIAEKTGLPLGTVKTRLRRGLITLREQLQRLGIANNQAAS